MIHCGTLTIETNRLVLRRLDLKDAQSMYNNWSSDPEVTKHLTWQSHDTIEATKDCLRYWSEKYSDPSFYLWGIELNALREVIGTISVVNKKEAVNMVPLGYCIGQPWWHQGITTEAVQAVVAFLFANVQCNRIEACHDVNNPYSGAVMEKCGMQFEGIRRSAALNNQGVCDVAGYAILREDFFQK